MKIILMNKTCKNPKLSLITELIFYLTFTVLHCMSCFLCEHPLINQYFLSCFPFLTVKPCYITCPPYIWISPLKVVFSSSHLPLLCRTLHVSLHLFELLQTELEIYATYLSFPAVHQLCNRSEVVPRRHTEMLSRLQMITIL